MIRAEVHSDDMMFEAKFDATPWFEQASDTDILELAGCDWGGDYPADHVAEFMDGKDPDVSAVFVYLARVRNTSNRCGFECHINDSMAMAWLHEHRPNVHRVLMEERVS